MTIPMEWSFSVLFARMKKILIANRITVHRNKGFNFSNQNHHSDPFSFVGQTNMSIVFFEENMPLLHFRVFCVLMFSFVYCFSGAIFSFLFSFLFSFFCFYIFCFMVIAFLFSLFFSLFPISVFCFYFVFLYFSVFPFSAFIFLFSVFCLMSRFFFLCSLCFTFCFLYSVFR